jgi:hypothetical protein
MAHDIDTERTTVKNECKWLSFSVNSACDVTWQRLWLYGNNLWQTICEYGLCQLHLH